MKRSNIQRKFQKDAVAIVESTGTLIRLNNGAEFLASVSEPKQTETLTDGGFEQNTILTAHWPIGHAPKPVVGTILTLVADGRTFRTTSCDYNTGDPKQPFISVTAVRK